VTDVERLADVARRAVERVPGSCRALVRDGKGRCLRKRAPGSRYCGFHLWLGRSSTEIALDRESPL
jgi:hypothetical protein